MGRQITTKTGSLGLNKIFCSDCIELMKKLLDNSIDAIITDPPYGLEFMGKDWDRFKKVGHWDNQRGYEAHKDAYGRIQGKCPAKYRIENKAMNKGLLNYQFWTKEWAVECLRVLKPGGYLLAFGGTRTYHRLICGIEDAGFEIRDCIMWAYGSGFPKSHDISKAIDKMKGAKREVIGKDKRTYNYAMFDFGASWNLTAPATPEAKKWNGWGTALKPACEPIVVTRKPLSEKNVALNVLKWRTGGINIDACRIKHNEPIKRTNRTPRKDENVFSDKTCGFKKEVNSFASASQKGRFPSNLILDETAAKILDAQTRMKRGNGHWPKSKVTGYGKFGGGKTRYFGVGQKDTLIGGASRFFYVAKASKAERNLGCDELRNSNGGTYQFRENGSLDGKIPIRKNIHPTVKPIKLMEYLIKLVTRENAVVLDPFIGSGTTAIACLKLNRKFIGIDKEPEYCKIAKVRIRPYLGKKQ